MSNQNIRFDPVKILEIANHIKNEHRIFVETKDALKFRNIRMQQVWIGEAATQYHKKFNEITAEIESLASTLSELGEQLALVSGIYTPAEQRVEDTVERLPVEGVFK